MEMYRRTYAEINLDHLEHNIRVLQQSFPQAPFLCPMVKANAYGHGDVQLARFLETKGIKHLGVCLIEEGLRLRNYGVKTEILVFRGFDQVGAEKLVQFNLTPVVSSWEQVEFLEALPDQPAVSIHLKFDTGMNRLGFRTEEAQGLFDRLWQNKKIRVKALCTHLLNGEDAVSDNGKSAAQLQKLDKIGKLFKPFNVFCHALNSSGAISLMSLMAKGEVPAEHPLRLQNWGLRPGLMIYGYNSSLDTKAVNLKAVMSLRAQVNSFRRLSAGETVSYSGTWKAEKDSVIAVVLIGYADGYHRALSNKSSALFAGQKVPVVGNVCMDYLMIDVTAVVQGRDLKEFKDLEVTLFGYDREGNFISAEDLAKKSDSISWEILTSVGERVPRIYTGQDASYVTEEFGGQP